MSTPVGTPATFLDRPLRLFIDGDWVDGSACPLNIVDPSTGGSLVTSAAADARDVDLAVRAARRAFDEGPWPSMSPSRRARLIWALADALEANADEFALLESLDTGKPLRLVRKFEVPEAVEILRYNAGWATKLSGETLTPSLPGEWHATTLREPVGVAALIAPWNAPLIMATAKLAPALAAGCTAVLKPAELTPITSARLAELVAEVGFPPGVVNVVQGLGAEAGQALAVHPMVDKVAFTGSTRVGKQLLMSAAGNLKRLTLELGGKSPTIVFPDADLPSAIEAAALSIFGNAGQVCAAGSRLLVHREVADEVLAGVVEVARSIRVGGGLEPDSHVGPVISERQRERVLGYVDLGREEGAELLVGGAAMDRAGFFIEPTVFAGATARMRLVQEEVFGPVLVAQTFDDEASIAEVAAMANDTVYGLSASIWTRDLARAHRLAKRVRAGIVRINWAIGTDPGIPFGGLKESGWGKENGREGVEGYTAIKSVVANLAD